MRGRTPLVVALAVILTLCAAACAAPDDAPTQYSGRPTTIQISAGVTFLSHQSHVVPHIPGDQSQTDWQRGIIVRESYDNNGTWLDTVLLPNGTESTITSYDDGALLWLQVSVGDYVAYYVPSDSNLRVRDVKVLMPDVLTITQGQLRPQPSQAQIAAAAAFMATQPPPVVRAQSGQSPTRWQRAVILRQLDDGNNGWYARVLLPTGRQETIYSSSDDGSLILARTGPGDYILFYTPSAQSGGLRDRDLQVLRQQAVPIGM
jgi:hypothetical protein